MNEPEQRPIREEPDGLHGERGARVTLSTGANGTCVVTTRAVEQGQVLLVLDGTLGREPGRHTLQVGPDLHLASPTRTEWQFINHACAPTARMKLGQDREPVRLVASTPLVPGQEVTFNYLTTEWDMATPFRCTCQAPSCVGWIQGARHLNDLQIAGLRSDFAPHIRELLRLAGRLREP